MIIVIAGKSGLYIYQYHCVMIIVITGKSGLYIYIYQYHCVMVIVIAEESGLYVSGNPQQDPHSGQRKLFS